MLIRKSQEKNQQLDRMMEAVNKERIVFESFALPTNVKLQGVAWDSARSYINNIQIPLLNSTRIWLDSQISANRKYNSAGESLPNVNCLDQAKLETNLAYWKRRLSREQDKEDPSRSVIRNCRSMIKDIESKLDAIDRFISRTSGIFDSAQNMLSILQRADTEIAKVSYNATTNMLNLTGVDNTWLLQMEALVALEAIKADGLTEEQLKEAMKQGFTPGEVVAIWEEMKERGITRADLESMDKRGITFATIVKAWSGTESEEDKVLITGLIKGNYEEAFLAFPGNINASTQLFFAEYVLQTSINCSDEEVQKILNEILKAYKAEGIYEINGYSLSNEKAMGYITMLYAGTTSVMKLESLMLRDIDSLDDEQKKQLLVRNEKLMALSTMSGAIYDILKSEEVTPGYADYSSIQFSYIKIDQLCFNENSNSYTFDIAYKGTNTIYSSVGPMGEIIIDEAKSVITSILESSADVAGQRYLESRAVLEAASEELGSKLIGQIAIAGISTASPLVGAGMGILTTLSEGEYADVLGESYSAAKEIKFENEKINGALKGNVTGSTVKVIQEGLNYLKNKSKLNKEIEQLDRDTELLWFGQGGTYTVGEDTKMVVSGIYNPVINERIGVWESEGLAAMVEQVTGQKLFEVKLKSENKGETDEEEFKNKLTTDEEKILWEGGGIMEMSTDKFIESTISLSEKIQRETGVTVDIHNILHQ